MHVLLVMTWNFMIQYHPLERLLMLDIRFQTWIVDQYAESTLEDLQLSDDVVYWKSHLYFHEHSSGIVSAIRVYICMENNLQCWDEAVAFSNMYIYFYGFA